MKDKSIDGPGTPLPWDHTEGTVFGIEPECCGALQTIWDDDGHGNPIPVGEECCGSPVATQVGPVAECSPQNARYIVWSANNAPALVEALQEAKLQLEYMDERSPSGTTPTVLARIHAVLSTALGEMNDG